MNTVAPPRVSTLDSESLWDVHMCMNVLNRVTGRLHSDTPTLNLLFALSEHLRVMARIQRQFPSISADLLSEWIMALFALKLILEGQPSDPQCEINIVGSIEEIPISQLTRLLKLITRYAGSVRSLVLRAQTIHEDHVASILERLGVKHHQDHDAYEITLELTPHAGREPIVADCSNVPELKEKMISFRPISGGRYEAKFMLTEPRT